MVRHFSKQMETQLLMRSSNSPRGELLPVKLDDGGYRTLVGVVDDNYLVRAQQTLGDDEGADSIVGDSPTRVTYYVRLPHLEPKNISGCNLASIQVTAVTPRAGDIGRSPLSKSATYH